MTDDDNQDNDNETGTGAGDAAAAMPGFVSMMLLIREQVLLLSQHLVDSRGKEATETQVRSSTVGPALLALN